MPESACSELLLQLVPPSASKQQGPDRARVCRLGGCCFSRSRQRPASSRVPTVPESAGSEVAASVDPVNGPQATGSRLCLSLPARRLLAGGAGGLQAADGDRSLRSLMSVGSNRRDLMTAGAIRVSQLSPTGCLAASTRRRLGIFPLSVCTLSPTYNGPRPPLYLDLVHLVNSNYAARNSRLPVWPSWPHLAAHFPGTRCARRLVG